MTDYGKTKWKLIIILIHANVTVKYNYKIRIVLLCRFLAEGRDGHELEIPIWVRDVFGLRGHLAILPPSLQYSLAQVRGQFMLDNFRAY